MEQRSLDSARRQGNRTGGREFLWPRGNSGFAIAQRGVKRNDKKLLLS